MQKVCNFRTTSDGTAVIGAKSSTITLKILTNMEGMKNINLPHDINVKL